MDDRNVGSETSNYAFPTPSRPRYRRRQRDNLFLPAEPAVRRQRVARHSRPRSSRVAACVTEKNAGRPQGGKLVGLAGLAVHSVILVATYVFGLPWLTLAWAVGLGAVFPLFGTLRPLLEHRDERADARINFAETNHGAYTRMFGTDIFSSLFGAAGFNRHLLHHWEPSISYTNLAELEAYLLDTEAAAIIEMRRSSYFWTFVNLFHFR
jgi:fatty acid desaturase